MHLSTSWLFIVLLSLHCYWSGFHIFCRIIVALKEEVWYQKCHDPECRNFRSSSKLWAVYDGFSKPFPAYNLSYFFWKVTRCRRRSALATSWHELVHCFHVLIYSIYSSSQFISGFHQVYFSLTGWGRPALFNGRGWQLWTQPDSKLCTSADGICWRVGRQPRWSEICRVSGGLWTKQRRNPRSASAYVYARIGHVVKRFRLSCFICTELTSVVLCLNAFNALKWPFWT